MKKIIILLFVSSVILSVLAGCKEEAKPKSENKLVATADEVRTKENTPSDYLKNNKIKRLDIVYQEDLYCGSLTGKEKDKVLNIIKSVTEAQTPCDSKDITNDDNYTLLFYGKGDAPINNFWLKGHYIYWEKSCYKIPDNIYDKLLKFIEK